MNEQKFLTVPEVAELLRTSKQAVYIMVSRAKLPGVVKLGRRTLFEREALFDHLGL